MSLELLTHKLFDYAGMFAPAALPFAEALAKSAQFPTSLGHQGMVQNDIVLTPANWRKLDDTALAAADFTRVCRVCLVGVVLDDAPALLDEATTWNTEHGISKPPRVVTALEMHMPSAMPFGTAVGRVTAARHLARGRIDLYLEPKWDDATWDKRLDDLLAMYDALNADTELGPVGLKFRAWGDNAMKPATVARLLNGAVARGIPLKATQGLHHPLVEGHEQNPMGFLGLVTALRLAHTDTPLEPVLTESEPAAFDFEAMTYRGQALPKECAVPFSIGTCSLDEPDADLTRLFS